MHILYISVCWVRPLCYVSVTGMKPFAWASRIGMAAIITGIANHKHDYDRLFIHWSIKYRRLFQLSGGQMNVLNIFTKQTTVGLVQSCCADQVDSRVLDAMKREEFSSFMCYRYPFYKLLVHIF